MQKYVKTTAVEKRIGV